MATALIFLCLLALFTLALFWLAPRISRLASATSNKVVSPLTQFYVASGASTEIASLPADGAVRLNIKGSSVHVKREGAAGRVIVLANFPSNWRNSEGTISQVETAGTKMLSSASSATLKLVKIVSLNREPIDPNRVRIVGEDVLVDGKNVTVLFSGDELEVIVPEAFRGDLIIFNEGSDEVTIDRWNGGNVELKSTGSGDFTGGELIGLEHFRITQEGSGGNTFTRVDARDVEVSHVRGNFEVPSVSASKSFKLTVTGSGDVNINDTLNVEEGTIELPSGSNCNLTLGTVTAKHLTVNSRGSGNCEFQTVSGGTFKGNFAGSSYFTVTDRFNVENFEFTCDGTGDLEVTEGIFATASASIRVNQGSNCNVNVPTIDAPTIEVHALGTGNVDCYDVNGESFVGVFEQSSYFTVENTFSVSRFSLEMRGTGDASVSELKASEATVLSKSNSNVTISHLESESASLNNEGTGTIEIEDGRGARLALTTHNGGDITICGDFSSVSTSKSGTGTISL